MAAPGFVLAISGGPTPVANASLVGAWRFLQSRIGVGAILGARFGFDGLLNDDYVDLSSLSARQLGTLAQTPGAALGSSRSRLTDADLGRALERLAARNVRWMAVVGGNDSAEGMHRLHLAAQAADQPLGIVGIPKTVDNDLPHTDHTLGYGSAARMVALGVRGTGQDTAALRGTDPIKLVEVAGRNSGWLAAAAALARTAEDDPPQVIFLPERPRPLRQMVAEVETTYRATGYAVAVISENQPDDAGRPLAGGAAVATDPYGHPYFESPGLALARALRAELGVAVRCERPGNILRGLAGLQSPRDALEALSAGGEAAERALAGERDVMLVIEREPGRRYEIDWSTVPLASIAGQERSLPDEFIAASSTDVTQAFIRYARPLVGRLPPAVHLR